MNLHQTSARVGTFSTPSTPYGLPVSVVKPPDNIITPVGTVPGIGTSVSADNALNQGLSDYQTLLTLISSATTGH